MTFGNWKPNFTLGITSIEDVCLKLIPKPKRKVHSLGTKVSPRSQRQLIEPAIFGLFAALFWGTTDFVSRFPSKKIGSGYSTFYVQLFSLIAFSAFTLATGLPSSSFLVKGAYPALLDLVAGVLNVFGLMQLYRAFMIGNMSLSAPIAGSFPIFTILIGFIVFGQGIGLEKGVAIAIVISGVIMTGVSPEQPTGVDKTKRRNGSAVLSALTASVFFGAAYVCLNAGVGYFGSVMTIWFVRVGAVFFGLPFLLITTRKFLLPKEGAWKWILVMAVLDSSGFIALTLGYIYSGNSPALVTTLSSLLGAVTTVLAAVVYRDRLTKIQIVGIIILFLGVVIVLNV